MKKLKLHERWRLIVQCISFCFHNGYVRGWIQGKIYTGENKTFCVPGLNCYSCPGAVGACPIGSLQAVLDSGDYKISLYVFGFIAAIGVFCGRFVCGWLCPFGLVQDLLHRIPVFKKKKNMPGHSKLRWLRYVILVVFVIALPALVMGPSGSGEPWFCEWICPSGTLLGGIPLVIRNANLQSSIGFRFAWKCALLLAVIVLSVKFYRPFCKYVCPLGALYGLANPISIYRLKCDENTCIKCGACQKACGMDIKVWEKPNSVDCIRCGKCMAACPTGALNSTFTRKKKADGTTEVVLTKEAAASGITENVNVTAAAENSAPAKEAAPKAAEPAGKKIRVGCVILGVLSIVGLLIALGIAAFPPIIVAVDMAEFSMAWALTFFGPSFAALVAIAMAFYLAHYMLRTGKHPELIDQLRNWPGKILLTVLITYLIAVASYFAGETTGGFTIDLFWKSPVYIIKQWGWSFAIPAIIALLAMIPLHKKKT